LGRNGAFYVPGFCFAYCFREQVECFQPALQNRDHALAGQMLDTRKYRPRRFS
jgi:hypothetical protein